MTQEDELFLSHGIRPTAVRQLVWRTIAGMHHAFSLADVEDRLPSVDRSSIFRTLILFEEHHLLHAFEDGSGHRKYCLCLSSSDEETENHSFCQHVHASCSVCNRTFCLKGEQIPIVGLPQGFHAEHASFVVRGICGDCQRKGENRFRLTDVKTAEK